MMQRIATLAVCILVATSLHLPTAKAEEASTAPPQEEIVKRVLDLQRQIEELMAALPPEVRAELRGRLAALPAPTSPAPAKPGPEEIARVPTPRSVVEPVAEPAAAATAPPSATPATSVVAATSPGTMGASTDANAEPAPSDGIPKLIRRRSRRAPCNTLHTFDENGDGKISSADRYWRHLYLWTDKNRDRQIQDREVESAYDRRVREIAVSLETFIRTKGGLGEVRIEDRIVLDLRGDGFAERARQDGGILVADADALKRGNGPRLLGPGGEPLSGFQAFRSGLRFELSGKLTELNCP